MQNFPKHSNFIPFWWISEELWPCQQGSHFFWFTLYILFTTVISIVWISTWKLVWTENWIEIAKRFNWHSTVYTQLVVSNSHSKLELLWLLKEHVRWRNEGPGDICNNVGHHLLLCACSVPRGEANILLIRFSVSEASVLVREMHHQVNIPVWSHKYGDIILQMIL